MELIIYFKYLIHSQIDWVTFVNNIFSAVNKTVDDNETIIVYEHNYLKRLNNLIMITMQSDKWKK